MKKLFRQIHLWLSVPFGLIITVICFSGAALVFENEVMELCRPNLHPVEKVETAPPPTGKMVGKKGRRERAPFFRTMFRLHRWLLDSKPEGGIFWGKMIVGTVTLMFVLILVSGVVIWWPRTKKALKNSLKIVTGKGAHRFLYSLHVAGGMYALLFLLAMALTGLTWSFLWYRTGFYNLFGLDVTQRAGWIFSVHVGSWGGMTTRILSFLAALLGATLPLTGYYLWIRRLYRSKRK